VETTLYAPEGSGPRVPLASTNASVPFNPEGEVRMPTLQYLIINAQLLALEQRRVGDLRLELQVRGFLPQAATGFPGAPEVTEYISIAESRWRQQLAGLGRTLGAEMLIAFPDDDEPRRRVADFLREAQRLLGGSEIDSAMLQVRKALETIKNTSGWNWPGKKDKPDRTVDERWALIRAAMEDQASGAMHVDPGTFATDGVFCRGSRVGRAEGRSIKADLPTVGHAASTTVHRADSAFGVSRSDRNIPARSLTVAMAGRSWGRDNGFAKTHAHGGDAGAWRDTPRRYLRSVARDAHGE
jgi:hypothetical protein